MAAGMLSASLALLLTQWPSSTGDRLGRREKQHSRHPVSWELLSTAQHARRTGSARNQGPAQCLQRLLV